MRQLDMQGKASSPLNTKSCIVSSPQMSEPLPLAQRFQRRSLAGGRERTGDGDLRAGDSDLRAAGLSDLSRRLHHRTPTLLVLHFDRPLADIWTSLRH